ncbi:MAG: hypothetical protein WCP45_14795 [Verrucomicrobiota bacterium]
MKQITAGKFKADRKFKAAIDLDPAWATTRSEVTKMSNRPHVADLQTGRIDLSANPVEAPRILLVQIR